MTGGILAGSRARLALVAALALLGALAFATPASAFTQVTSFDGRQTPAGAMVPERMAVDESDGSVYVIDTASDAVDHFDRFGVYLGQLTGSQTTGGSLGFDGFEDSIAVDNSTAGTAGNVYIVGENNGGTRISAFGRDGSFQWQTGNLAFTSPPRELSGIAVNPVNGDVWVADRFNGMVRIRAADGTPVGDTPVGPSDTNAHMAFDSDGNMYAAPSQGGVAKYAAPVFGSTPTTVDGLGSFDVATDLSNGDVYVDHGGFIDVYDRTGAADPNSPFGSTATQLHGVAVDGSADRIFVSNGDTNDVEIWSHNLVSDTLTVTVDGSGTGTVDADHGPVLGCTSSGGVCTGSYIDGDPNVELTATADSGSTFTGWSGPDSSACSSLTAPTCDVPMNAAKNITATFDRRAPVTHNLRVSCTGTGSGSVAPVGCGATQPENDGSSVILTATPAGGSTFSNWTGCDSVSGNRCTASMTADRSVTATFNRVPQPTHTLSVSKAGTGSGAVTSSPGGIACGATCSALFNEGTSVTLTAVADSGSTFAGWSGGGCSGTGTCGVTLSGDTAVTATFTLVPPPPPPPPPPPIIKFVRFNSKTLAVSLSCTGVSGQTCSGKLTFKAVIKVKVKKGKKTKLVKKTITVGTASYRVAANGSGSVKLKLTSAAKTALKRGALTAKSSSPKATIHLPKTKVKKKKKH